MAAGACSVEPAPASMPSLEQQTTCSDAQQIPLACLPLTPIAMSASPAQAAVLDSLTACADPLVPEPLAPMHARVAALQAEAGCLASTPQAMGPPPPLSGQQQCFNVSTDATHAGLLHNVSSSLPDMATPALLAKPSTHLASSTQGIAASGGGASSLCTALPPWQRHHALG